MTDDDIIWFLPQLGHTGDGALNLEFPREYEAEILALLDEQGIEHDRIFVFSSGPELLIEAAKVLSVPGGLAALASVYHTFSHRHDGKKVRIKRDDPELEISGMSPAATLRFLEQVEKDQAAQDERWRQILSLDPEQGID